MKKAIAWLRTLNAGEWIALSVLVFCTLMVCLGCIATVSSNVASGLQPEMPITKTPDYDLIAQRSMSAAAWWMVLITGLSTVVGGLGLYLIARTLQEAKRSADAANDAVQAAENAAIEAREVGQAQVRAYVIVKFAQASHQQSGNMWVEARFKNSGQTPAKHVHWKVTGYVSLIGDTRRDRVVFNRAVVADMATNEEDDLNFQSRAFTEAATELRKRGAVDITLEVAINYEDVFGVKSTAAATYVGRFNPHPGTQLDLKRQLPD